MPRGRRWSNADIDRLIAMREVEGLIWREIGEAFDDTASNCCTRYKYYKEKRAEEAIRGPALPSPRKPQPVTPKADPPVAANAARVHRPRYFHKLDLDIIARIDRQGLTAGFLGDPPAGRSALDQKRNL